MSTQITSDAQWSQATANFRRKNRLLVIKNIGYNVPCADFKQACREKLTNSLQPPAMHFFWQVAAAYQNLHRGRVEVGFDHREPFIRAQTELRDWTFRGRQLNVEVAARRRATWEGNTAAANTAGSPTGHPSGSGAGFPAARSYIVPAAAAPAADDDALAAAARLLAAAGADAKAKASVAAAVEADAAAAEADAAAAEADAAAAAKLAAAKASLAAAKASLAAAKASLAANARAAADDAAARYADMVAVGNAATAPPKPVVSLPESAPAADAADASANADDVATRLVQCANEQAAAAGEPEEAEEEDWVEVLVPARRSEF